MAIEEEVRKCLKLLLTGSDHKSNIIKKVVENEDVQLYWLITQADFDVGDDDLSAVVVQDCVQRTCGT